MAPRMSFLLVTPLTGRSVSPGDPADQLLRPASCPGVRGSEGGNMPELWSYLDSCRAAYSCRKAPQCGDLPAPRLCSHFLSYGVT